MRPRCWQKARQGDTRAFDELITRHRNNGRICTPIKCSAARTDAVEIARSRRLYPGVEVSACFDGRRPFPAGCIALPNAATDLCRRRKSHPEVEVDNGPRRSIPPRRLRRDIGEEPGTSGTKEIRCRIEAALLQLSLEHRAVVVLKESSHLSYVAHRRSESDARSGR